MQCRLFRGILRAHRQLPREMRLLGDDYVKAGPFTSTNRPQYPLLTSNVSFNEEFRRHQKIDNPLHIIGFLSQWKMYLDGMPQGQSAKEFKGKKLDSTVYEKVRKLCHLTVYKAEPYLFTL